MVSEPAQHTSQNESQRGIDYLLEEVAQRRLNGNADEARAAAMERQHDRGKLSARERLDILFDAGSFVEIDPFVKHRGSGFGLENNRPEGDAVVVGHGTVDGRIVFAYAQDFTLYGGSVSEAAAEKIVKVQDLSMKVGAPIVAINDGGGARIQEGVTSLRGYGEIFLRNTLSSGLVPQIAICAGPAAGGGVYSPAIMDFIFMVQGTGQMYITGPDVIRAVSGEEVTHEELGGALTHATKTGVAHFCIPGEEATLNSVRQLLAFLPQNNMEDARWTDTGDSPDRKLDNLVDIVPADSTRPYDIRRVIRELVDNGEFMEIQAQWARNVVIGFAHMGGYGVGIVANDPDTLAGVLDIDASRKAARFVRFCDCFNIPIITLVDVPGFLPGTQQEYGGIIAHGAKLLYAYAEATVPKVAVTLRKSIGGAYVVMSSKHLRSDINLAWPTAQIAVTGSDGAVNIIHRRRIAAAEDPAAERAKLIAEYEAEFYRPYQAAELGFVDDVIHPRDTRTAIFRALDMLADKVDTSPPKKHGNIPL